MVVAILGNPLAGKHTLAAALSPLLEVKVVTFTDLRDMIERSETERASIARTLIAAGETLADKLMGELLAEAAGDDDVMMVGRPRNVGEVDSFTRVSSQIISVVLLEADQKLIDARRAARGLPPIEDEHPGALRRLRHELQPVLDRARDSKRLLTLDSAMPVAELAECARVFIQEQRTIGG